MDIKSLGYNFAHHKGIPIREYKRGMIAKGNGFYVVFYEKKDESLLRIRYKFPVKRLNESQVLVRKKTAEIKLNMSILHGCIPDYLQMLDKEENDGNLCDLIHMSFSSHNNFIEEPTKLVDDNFDVADLEDIQTMLSQIYPARN